MNYKQIEKLIQYCINIRVNFTSKKKLGCTAN